MLKWFYQKIKIQERSLTSSSLLRLRICSVGALIFAPLFTAIELLRFGSIEGPLRWAIIIAFMACMVPVALSRMADMLVFSDKYLDEWEIRLKKRSEAFGYRCFVFTIAPATIALVLMQNNPNWTDMTLSFSQIMFAMVNAFFAMILLPIIYAAWSQRPLDASEDLDDLSDIVV